MGKSKVSMSISVDICIEKDEKGFYAYCPSFKGLHTCGDTVKDALKNAKEATTAYIVSLLKHHKPIPCCTIVRDEAERICSNGKTYSETIEIPELV